MPFIRSIVITILFFLSLSTYAFQKDTITSKKLKLKAIIEKATNYFYEREFTKAKGEVLKYFKLEKDTLSEDYSKMKSFRENIEYYVKQEQTFKNERIPPQFPGCEKAGFSFAMKQCLINKTKRHLLKFFDSDLPRELNLPNGKIEIEISFIIDEDGKIGEVKVNEGIHPMIVKECIRVMKLMPELKSGTENQKPTSFSYSIPFSILVE